MKVLFVSLVYSEGDDLNFYEDLLQEFIIRNHKVYVACAAEKRKKACTHIETLRKIKVLRIQTGNITGNVSLFEKGISTIRIPYCFNRAIKKYFENINFDLILYPTPPITLANTVRYLKKNTGAVTYLLLKDIFPQNAVDLGMIKKHGIKSLIYYYFRNKEIQLYRVSDFIGCMSPANCEYLLRHNGYLHQDRIEVCPNVIKEPKTPEFHKKRFSLKKVFGVPDDAVVFIYGGNLGKPQGVDFLIKCIDAEKDNKKVFFFIIGEGKEFPKLEKYMNLTAPKNVRLLRYLPKNEYQELAEQCDVGMIFLDYHFTIPNFPSRILSYLEAGLPAVIAADECTDLGTIAEKNGFGFCCRSNDVQGFCEIVDKIVKADRVEMGKNGWNYFLENYTAEKGCEIISRHFAKRESIKRKI